MSYINRSKYVPGDRSESSVYVGNDTADSANVTLSNCQRLLIKFA